jgi:phosphoserine phosphatase
MDKKKYIQVQEGLFLNKKKSYRKILQELHTLQTYVFDLDGTLLEGYALGIVSFATVLRKLATLDFFYLPYLVRGIVLYLKLKKMPIEKSSTEFAKSIKGLNEKDFLASSKKIVEKIYPAALETIKNLVINKKDLAVLSLSDESIISNTISTIGISKFKSRKLVSKNGFYTGKFDKEMLNAQKLKKDYSKFFVKNKKYVYFGNDLDDLLIIKKATIKIGINPTSRILEKIDFDLIAEGKDPWEKINLLFREN